MAAEEPVEFTRGSLGAADTRGLSLVERHVEARARALEEETLARLHAIFNGSSSSSLKVPPSVLALAASAAPGGPDAGEAEALVREFLADKGRELERLFRTARGGDGKATSSDGDGSSSDDDDDDDRKKGRHRRSSKHKKKDSKKHDSKRKKSRKDKKKKRRRRSSDESGSDSGESEGGGEKRAKKAAAPATTAALTSQYGSHGLLRAENPHDAELKRSEFFSWCSEVKRVASMEALAKWEETELWKTYVEDFNTATLPSERYYDLIRWQQQRAREEEEVKRRRGKGEGGGTEISAADDEAARRAEAKQRREDEAAERLKEAYNALKYSDAGKKEDMMRQELLRIELQVAARTGDTEKVARLQKLLAPDPK